jgi:hydroxyethylthiazole kinase
MSRTEADTVTEIARAVRERAPLVQCITNYVSMDVVANVLNAVGASPAMVHDAHESGEFAGIASAVAINIGTPSPAWVEGMTAAVRAARAAGTPWVLDPVAVGATTYRREIVADLLTYEPAVIRGNASEILSISTSTSGGRGVDSAAASSDAAESAASLARARSAVVVVTGASDVVTDGTRTAIVHGGDARMPLITALGCASTALVAACCAVADDAFEAAVAAMAMLAVAGERAGRSASGPGTLRVLLLDELAALDAERLAAPRIELA